VSSKRKFIKSSSSFPFSFIFFTPIAVLKSSALSALLIRKELDLSSLLVTPLLTLLLLVLLLCWGWG
jgi:hypothetical protein